MFIVHNCSLGKMFARFEKLLMGSKNGLTDSKIFTRFKKYVLVLKKSYLKVVHAVKRCSQGSKQ
jgi:hypothetical protein